MNPIAPRALAGLALFGVVLGIASGASAAATFVHETIDATGDVGQYVSLKIDAARRPHVAYRDADPANLDLKYAVRTGNVWLAEVVDFEIKDEITFVNFCFPP
jgi:hypothetical protein